MSAEEEVGVEKAVSYCRICPALCGIVVGRERAIGVRSFVFAAIRTTPHRKGSLARRGGRCPRKFTPPIGFDIPGGGRRTAQKPGCQPSGRWMRLRDGYRDHR